jgi:hypothetical protein
VTDSKAAFARAIGTPSAPEPTTAGEEVEELEHLSKFTALFDSEVATTFDQLALTIRRQLRGLPVKKADIMRSLIMLAADDPTLRNQVAEDLRKRTISG